MIHLRRFGLGFAALVVFLGIVSIALKFPTFSFFVVFSIFTLVGIYLVGAFLYLIIYGS